MSNVDSKPVVQAEMLIRRPVSEVFRAFVDPEVTTQFWFTKSSGMLEAGKQIRWDWEMYGVFDLITVQALEPDRRILIESSDGTITEWIFASRSADQTFVTIIHSGYEGTDAEIMRQAVDSMGGYTMVLCGLKALLEHNVKLNLVADKAPDAHVSR